MAFGPLACGASSAPGERARPAFAAFDLDLVVDLVVVDTPPPAARERPTTIAEAPTPAALAPVAEEAVERKPIAWRITRRRLSVYAAPSRTAEVRGRIPIHKAFAVFAHVEVDGPGCDEPGWADVGGGGFLCLAQTRKAGTYRPKELPVMRAGLTPFHYARNKGDGSRAPRWKNLAAFEAGTEPMDRLALHTDYAFKYRKRHKGTVVLIDEEHRVVRLEDVHAYRPSRFEGRDLRKRPIPAGRRLAWTVKWPRSPARSRPDEAADVSAKVAFHTELLVDPAPVAGDGGPFYRRGDGKFLRAAELKVFIPADDIPTDVAEDELWLDVDLEQQTLAMMRGTTPEFVTLVSSGFKRATPRGIFRIHWKQAIGSMQSAAGADDPYDVQAVPHVQYFVAGFALHSAYWHNFFGRRVSHGCINLAPKDALRVFRRTSPRLEGGWDQAYETRADLGTTLRVRKGDEVPRDRRGDPAENFGGTAQSAPTLAVR